MSDRSQIVLGGDPWPRSSLKQSVAGQAIKAANQFGRQLVRGLMESLLGKRN